MSKETRKKFIQELLKFLNGCGECPCIIEENKTTPL